MDNRIFLKNDNIRLRPIEPEDLGIIYEFENDESLWMVSSTSQPYSRFIIKQFFDSQTGDIYIDKQIRLMIETIDSDDVVGCVDLSDFSPTHLRAEIGILIKEKYRKRGIAKEALELIEGYASFHLHLKQLYAFTSEDNRASYLLFESLGYKQTGKLSNWWRKGDNMYDVYIWQKMLQTTP